MRFCRFAGVMRGVLVMTVGQVGVVPRGFLAAFLMVFCGFAMVSSRVLMMVGCFVMMLGCCLGHKCLSLPKTDVFLRQKKGERRQG